MVVSTPAVDARLVLESIMAVTIITVSSRDATEEQGMSRLGAKNIKGGPGGLLGTEQNSAAVSTSTCTSTDKEWNQDPPGSLYHEIKG